MGEHCEHIFLVITLAAGQGYDTLSFRPSRRPGRKRSYLADHKKSQQCKALLAVGLTLGLAHELCQGLDERPGLALFALTLVAANVVGDAQLAVWEG